VELIHLSSAQRLLRGLFLSLALVFTLLPISWIVSIAIRPGQTAVFPITILPPSLTLDNLQAVVSGPRGMGVGPFVNAALYGAASALVTVIASVLGGYALARYRLRLGEPLLIIILALSFLPTVSRIVPLFILLSTSGLYGTQLGVVLAYAAGSIPLGIWLMAGAFRQIPVRLEQAARMDGAGVFLLTRRIILPLAMPGILVVATLAFIDGWNSFSLPLILLPRDDLQPYTVALQRYVADVGFGVNWPLLSAGSVLGVLPVLILFAVLQRRLVRVGGLGGAIKG
jgi:multiple sugar transport system permease protein